jgi:hypothetical protein
MVLEKTRATHLSISRRYPKHFTSTKVHAESTSINFDKELSLRAKMKTAQQHHGYQIALVNAFQILLNRNGDCSLVRRRECCLIFSVIIHHKTQHYDIRYETVFIFGHKHK